MGSLYVNDFNSFGRVYQVRAQADAQYRQMDRWSRSVRCSRSMRPTARIFSRDNNGFTAADINGGPAPGYSSDQAQAAIERIAAETLPKGFTFEWTDLT